MTELPALRRLGGHRMLALGISLLLCAAILSPGQASGAGQAWSRGSTKEPLLIPPAFRLPASNGYTVYMAALTPRAGNSGKLLVAVYTRGKQAIYMAPATVTEDAIQSNLGELGEVSVSFTRSNRAATAPCGKRKIQFDSGQWEGKIAFHGEEGYTSVEATATPGNIDYFLSGACGEGFVSGGPAEEDARGAELFVRNPALGPQLSVYKSRPGAPASIIASTSEFTNGISIDRRVGLRMPAGRFTYDRRLRTATVHPPAPFAGSAQFDLGKKAGQRWSGDLTVDLPGRAGVPLTGPALRAYLVRSE